jgi:Rrf2 family protein
MRLELTRRGDYAIRAMLALAKAGHDAPLGHAAADGRLSVARIATAEAIPPRILPSVMGLLKRAGLVEVQTGRTGGYRLARGPERISVLEIIEAIEGDTRRRTCVLRAGPCLANGQCAVHGVFSAAQEALRSSLASATLQRPAGALPSDPPDAITT